ncbi:MAG: hypothetical protein GF393_02075, partial [Armatimonadia bacterium]|nr:hypothetical protein [Armatimonadia bacterium]
MNATRWTVVLLAIAAVLAAAVPSIREGIDYFLVGGLLAHPDKLPAPEQVDRIVQEHPDDALLALGRAEYFQGLRGAAAVDKDDPYRAWSSYWLRRERSLPSSVPTEQETTEAYRVAIERSGDAPAARARYALRMLLKVGSITFPDEPADPPPSLSVAERGHMGELRDALHEWRSVDPGNGTPTAMIAWALIAQGKADEALDELRALERADHWDDYEREALSGAMAVLTEAGHTPRTTSLFIVYPACYSKARHISRFVSSRAHEERRAGHYWVAVSHYVAALRIGMLLAESPRPLDFLSAIAVFGLVSAEDDPGGASGRPTPEQLARRRLAAMEGLANYLRANGAPSMAEEALDGFARYQDRYERYSEASDAFRQWQWEAWGSPPVTNARVLWWTLSTLVLVVALAGLVALFLRPQRNHLPLQWRWREWLALTAALVIPMQIWFGLLAEPIGPPEERSVESAEDWTEIWAEQRRQPIIPPRLRRAMDRWVPPALIAIGLWAALAAAADLERRRKAGGDGVPARRVLHD